jgi:hypothetical protein
MRWISGWYLYLNLGNQCPRRSPCGPLVSCWLYSKHLRNYWIDILWGVFWLKKPLHHNQFAYWAGMSTETALFQVTHRPEKSLNHKEIMLGAFIDIEGAFDNTSFDAITMAARQRGVEETCCRWISSMLESRLVHTSLMGCSLTAKDVGGCQQGGVLSPLFVESSCR